MLRALLGDLAINAENTAKNGEPGLCGFRRRSEISSKAPLGLIGDI